MVEEENKTVIIQVDPTTFEFQQYTEEDNILISSSRLDTAFTSSTDYIEYYAYDENQSLIFPLDNNIRAFELKNYSVIEGDTCLYPAEDINEVGYDGGKYYSTYNFYRKLLGSDITTNYYISEISGDRTELRLKSNIISDEDMVQSGNEFITSREESDYFVDFLLNFGNDQQVIANNFKVDTELEEPSFLIKLLDPLPPQFQLKTTLWVVEEISTSQAYNIQFPIPVFEPNDFQIISGPNYSLKITQEQGSAGQQYNFNTLLGTDLTSSFNQLESLLDKKEVNISVDYTDYENFVHFSSALTRVENFAYKVGLIGNYTEQITSILGTEGTNTAYSSSKATLTGQITDVIKNFDGYEYFLYFNSGSAQSWPKTNTEPPYILATTGSNQALTWLGSTDEDNAYYGGQAVSASNFDAENDNYLYNAIPEYLRSDPNNQKYELFVDMVAQQYDNTWLYTKDLTNRFNADNRLDYGISRDLVADAIRDFGIKLYSSNFNTDDLYTSFLGITPSGSTFPFPNMTGSIGGVVDTPSGFEYVNNEISASNDIVPQNEVNQQLYKRIYHNVPSLLKKKGTIAGLRALITSYGIPSTILRVSEFGGRDRDFTLDWDLEQDVFNYKFHLEGEKNPTFLSSSFQMNNSWVDSPGENSPQSLQFRFQTAGIPTSSLYQQVWVGDATKTFITLSYTGSGYISGSYSGSVPTNNNAYGQLRFYPEGAIGHTQGKFAQIDLPFFDKGWWSVQASFDYDASGDKIAYLYGANRIGEEIGFSDTGSITVADPQYWSSTELAYLPSGSALTLGPIASDVYGVAKYGQELYGLSSIDYQPLTGSLQEVRYWDVVLSESLFYDYVVNPYSTQGNSINSTPQELVFRADLGTELNTGSRESIHPKVTGSWATTQSFATVADGSSFGLKTSISGSFLQNTESIYYNQTPGGIKNRVSDRIRIVDYNIPSGSTLSPYRSIQQESFPSGSNQSINYLEVAFSPQNQINDDIIAQIGDFNLGEYIGDPRQISESKRSYPALDKLRDEYFTKYINSYDLNDFIRLIKFFDNSLFKMIEDFTPARTTLSSGVVIKQNLLERNVQAPPSMSYDNNITYSGSVKSFARDYNVHFAKEHPGNSFINDDTLFTTSGQTTVNLKIGNGATTITPNTNRSGSGATFIPLIRSVGGGGLQVRSFQVILTGSGYEIGEILTFTSQSISASIAPSLQVTPGSPTSIANDVVYTVEERDLAPILSPNSDFPQQNYASGSSIYRYNGGTGGVFEPFNNIYAAPVSESSDFFNYFYDFTSSISSTSIASASGAFFAFNSEDGATATKIFISSLSNGNRPHSDYSPNIYDPLTQVSASLATTYGQSGIKVDFGQLTQLVNKIYNPAKNNYANDLRAKYLITGLNYISPPLVTGTNLIVRQQPITGGTTTLAGPFTIPVSSTTGNGTGATIRVTMLAFFGGGGPTTYTAVSCVLVDIGLDYNAGEFMTITSTALQAAGFPAIFDKDLRVEVRTSNQSTLDNTGYWDLDVTPISAQFGSGNFNASTFTMQIPYMLSGVPTFFESNPMAAYTAMFEISEGPYSGLTGAEVSASQFAHQYPGFVQKFQEPFSTNLGIGMPMGSSITSSTSNQFGQGPFSYDRFDQREFYNGEFINVLNPGLFDDNPCKAFFGQDSRIDYFFFIQWFNDNIISENNFLSNSTAFQPQPGNNWFWADVVSFPASGETNSLLQGLQGAGGATTTTQNATNRVTNFTYTGPGAQGSGGVIEVQSSANPSGGPYNLNKAYFVETSLISGSSNLTQAISTNITSGTNNTYTNVAASSTSGTGDGTARFNATVIAQTVSSIEATVTGSLYDIGDTITFNAGTFGGSSTALTLTLRSDDLFTGVQKKYNGDRTITITSATLIAAGFANASQDLTAVLQTQRLNPVPSNKVKYIKMSNEDINGEDTLAFIQDSNFVTYTLEGAADYANDLIDAGFETYFISNASVQFNPPNENVLLFIDQEPSTTAVTSYDELFYDFSFSASGQFVYYATSSGEDPNVIHETGITRSVAQGYFPPEADSATSLWSTESFFRGWATANWWDITNDGGLAEAGNLGYYFDPLNNFNTGSNETNNDEENPYKVSTYPWFMNAGDTGGNGGSTQYILSASSTLGSLGPTDLQFYTGSITASAERIPIAFQKYVVPSPTSVTIPEVANDTGSGGSGGGVNTILITPDSGLSFVQNNGVTNAQIQVDCSLSSGQWSYSITFLDGTGWLSSISPTQNQTQTGDGVVQFTVDPGYTGGGNTSTFQRQVLFNFTNITNPSQNVMGVTITQFYELSGGGGGVPSS